MKNKGEQRCQYKLKHWKSKGLFDILHCVSENVTLVQLRDSYGNVNHAVNFFGYCILIIIIIVIFISVIDQGTGPIKLFMLSIIFKFFIDFHPESLLDTGEGIGRYWRSYSRYFVILTQDLYWLRILLKNLFWIISSQSGKTLFRGVKPWIKFWIGISDDWQSIWSINTLRLFNKYWMRYKIT